MILYSHTAHTAHTFKIGGLFAADPLTQAGDTKWRNFDAPHAPSDDKHRTQIISHIAIDI